MSEQQLQAGDEVEMLEAMRRTAKGAIGKVIEVKGGVAEVAVGGERIFVGVKRVKKVEGGDEAVAKEGPEMENKILRAEVKMLKRKRAELESEILTVKAERAKYERLVEVLYNQLVEAQSAHQKPPTFSSYKILHTQPISSGNISGSTDLLCSGDKTDVVEFYSIGAGKKPSLVSEVEIQRDFSSCVISGKNCYVCTSCGVLKISLLDPKKPKVIHKLHGVNESVRDLAFYDDFAYVLTEESEELVACRYDDGGFTEVWRGAYNGYRLQCHGRHLYVTSAEIDDYGQGLFTIFSLANPYVPYVVASLRTSASQPLEGFSIFSDTAYLAAWESGIIPVDISNPTAPSLQPPIRVKDSIVHDLHVMGNVAFITRTSAEGETELLTIKDTA